MTVREYRHKTAVVDAIKLTEDNIDQVVEWINGGYKKRATREYLSVSVFSGIIINTPVGALKAYIGDWVVRDQRGEFYPYKHTSFVEAYDPVGEP